MIPKKLYDWPIERDARIAAMAAAIKPLFDAGHLGKIIYEGPEGVGVMIAPPAEWPRRLPNAFENLLEDGIENDPQVLARNVVTLAERNAVGGYMTVARNSSSWALTEVLREHRARLDLVILYPDSSACEILTNSHPVDREEFLANRPGAIDLTAMPLLDAVRRVEQHRARFGVGLAAAKPATLTGKTPMDTYYLVATHEDGADGDCDLIAGVSSIHVDCRVPLEDRWSAIADLWHARVAIAELEDWQFEPVTDTGDYVPSGEDYEPEQGLYERAGELDLHSGPHELSTRSSEAVAIDACAVPTATAHILTPRGGITAVPATHVYAVLAQYPGSVRIDLAHQAAADAAMKAYRDRGRHEPHQARGAAAPCP